ncbi:MAG: 5-formyltetrahydrofolate cyclo-ligase [Ferruginibacter sp.]
MDKASLRMQYREKRAAISPLQKEKLEDLMLIRFQKLAIEIPAHIMTYAPIEKFNEFNPIHITDYCFFKNPGQSLFYPLIPGKEAPMQAILVNDDTLFETSRFGIDEPANGMPMFAEEIDMVLVPLLCFDELGYRVGYGKGYYDRFLQTCRKDVLKIGFSFFEAEKKINDIHKDDVRLDYCITPEKTYSFSKKNKQ